jgi:hypothetical protein
MNSRVARFAGLALLGALLGAGTARAGEAPFVVAKWIAPPAAFEASDAPLPLFRKEFSLAERPRHATLRIVGLGDYAPFVNGYPVTETGLNQPWSQYEKTLYYRDFDVTGLLQPGANCVGISLGNSFWNNPNPPQGRYNKAGPQRRAPTPFLLRAELIWDTGQGPRRLGTDASWRVAPGPIVFSHVYAGEDFDARRDPYGWDRPGFDAAQWQPPRLADAPQGALKRQFWPGIRVLDRFDPVAVKQPEPGVWLYVFPQNCAAQLRVRCVGGAPGSRITFRCGEHKNDQDRLFGAYVVETHLITDGQPLLHRWRFFYLGRRGVEVRGAVPEGEPNPDHLPVIKTLELWHVRTALPTAGHFRCSSELYNRTHDLIDWAMRNNTSHVLTDCPHREKLGWLECAYLLEPTFLYRYDARSWFAKIAGDIRDAQEPSGRVLTVAPSYPAGRFPDAFNWTVEWGAAAVLTPWRLYEWTGDAEVLRDSFASMCRFTDYVASQARDGLAPGGLGDWYDYGHGKPPGPSRFTPVRLSATATWAMCARACAQAAEILQRPAAARRYREMQAAIRRAFQRHFYDADRHALRHSGSPQCANAMALEADLVPAADRDLLVRQIVADLEQRGWQQTPGDIGHVYFIRALAHAGRSDVLHRVYSRTGKGSYGGILAKGLTAMPETWDAMMDGYQSLDHCMLGHVIEWFYGYVAGIRQAKDSVGWRNVRIAPVPGALQWAEASVRTPRGVVSSRWRREPESGLFRLEVELPPHVIGVAVLPSGRQHSIAPGRQTLVEPDPAARRFGALPGGKGKKN